MTRQQAAAGSHEPDPPTWCRCILECQFAVDETEGRRDAGCIKHFCPGDEWMLRRKVRRAINAITEWADSAKPIAPSPATWDSMVTLLKQIDEEVVEAHDAYVLNDRLALLLTRTADALKGTPEPLHLHGWHDLPEVAAALVAKAREALGSTADPTLPDGENKS